MALASILARAVAASLVLGSGGVAEAQQVIVCFTLHNDLANFDRRAKPFDKFIVHLGELRAAHDRAVKQYADTCVGQSAALETVACDDLAARAYERRTELDQEEALYARSSIGAADPVRLNIIAEMRRNGCLYQAEGDYKVDRKAQRMVPPGYSHAVRVKG